MPARIPAFVAHPWIKELLQFYASSHQTSTALGGVAPGLQGLPRPAKGT